MTPSAPRPRRVLIMAGGTGGHVFPALACARGLQAEGLEVHWLGTRNGLEARVVPAAGLPIHYLDISGLRGKGVATLALAPFRLVRALWQARRVVRELRPALVLGLGGFVTGPGGLAARLAGVPLVIHEQNAVPGLTNRLLARIAQRVMQAFPHSFPARTGATTTGNPLRAEIVALDGVYQPHTPPRLLVLGGSLGAQALNQAVPAALAQSGAALEVWHQTGRQHAEATQAEYVKLGVAARVVPFIEEMAAAYAWADLVLCRAGALTVSELAQAGRPALLVPFPHAVDDHQSVNAQVLVGAGAARLLPQPGTRTDWPLAETLGPVNLARVLDELCADPARLREMAAAARGCAHPDALQRVVAVCREVMAARW